MSYIKSFYHIIFRTYRSEMTISEAHEKSLYMYIYATCKNRHIKLWRINSMPDHIHMLVSIPPDISVSSFVKDIKQISGNYIKKHKREFPMFYGWAEGYCCITYCEKERDAVVQYIMNQKEHHKKIRFADELRSILLEAGIEINEKYFAKDWES